MKASRGEFEDVYSQSRGKLFIRSRFACSLIPIVLMCACERDPTVTRWRLQFDSGWIAAGIYRSDYKRVSYGSFEWSIGRTTKGEELSEEFAIKVRNEDYSMISYDPEVLQSLGFQMNASPGIGAGREMWSGEFANGGVNLTYETETRKLVRVSIRFFRRDSDNMESEFGFYSAGGRVVDSEISEKDASSVFGSDYNTVADRYLEF